MPVEGDWAYSELKADRAVNFFERALVHTKGRYAGRRFKLRQWQEEDVIRPLFGTVRWSEKWGEWIRAYNTAWIELGRGNGKSEILAGCSLYLTFADNEESSEVYGAASDREQAGLVYNVSERMVQLSPFLRKRLTVVKSSKTIVHYPTNSFYKIISADAAGNLGQAPHGIVFDEIIAQPNQDLYDALRTGFGKRVQPLMICATTAGNDLASFAAAEHDFSLMVEEQPELAPSRFVYIRNTPDGADPWDEDTWHLANPALGDFLELKTLRDEAIEAQSDPRKEAAFRQFRLNQWISNVTFWMPLSTWDATAGLVVEEDLVGRRAIGGLDLAATTDLAALAWYFPATDEDKAKFVWRFWTPEAAAEDLSKRTGGLFGEWVKSGFVTVTEGDVIDYDVIHDQIKADASKFAVQSIRVDRWNSTQTVTELEKAGLDVHTIGQGYGDFSPGMKETFKQVKDQRVEHGGNPVARWNFNATKAKIDPNENIKPVKPDRASSKVRIDGAVAAIMAVGEWIRLEAITPPRTGVIDLEEYA